MRLSVFPRWEIVITDTDGLMLDRLIEGIDFYVAGSGLSYYINKMGRLVTPDDN